MRQTHILLIVALLFAGVAQAQDEQEVSYPFRSDLEKGSFEKAEDKILKRLSKDSTDMECCYAAYRLYSHPSFPGYNEERAYYSLTRAYKLYIHAHPKLLDHATRNGFSGSQFDSDMRRVCTLGAATAHRRRSVDSYQHFLDYFVQAPQGMRDSIADCRDTLELASASLGGTVESLQQFIDRRPQSKVLTLAVRCRDSIAFAAADALHGIAAYEQFRSAYPQSHLFARATDSLFAIEFRSVRQQDAELYYRAYAERHADSRWADSARYYADSIEFHRLVPDPGRWEQLMAYYDEHPDRPCWSRRALTRWADLAHRRQLLEGTDRLLQRLGPADSLRQPLAQLLRNACLHPSIRNYPQFYADHPGLMPDSVRLRDSLAYAMLQRYNFYNSDSCIRAIAPGHDAFMMLQQLLKDDIDHQRWTEAGQKAAQYSQCFGNDYDYRLLAAALAAEADPEVRVTALASLNTAKGDEYSPVVSIDGKTLYYAGKKRPDNLGGTDIFVARRAGKWGKGSISMDLSRAYANEVPTGLSTDGNKLIMIQGGQLLQALCGPKGWEKAQPLPGLLPDSNWKADATLAANGRVLFFAAYGRTERELAGSQNIYVSVMDDSGRWSRPVELGATVNTPYDDRSPLLHPDMRTLYFSSEGHGSLGQRDMFVCRRLSDSSWTEWSEPVNIGKEVNGTDDDFGYCVDAEGKHAYCSRRTPTQDIYCVTLPQRSRPDSVVLVTGTVKSSTGKKLGVDIRWYDAATGALLGQCSSHPVTGSYTFALPVGRRYSYGVYNPDYQPQPETIDLTGEHPASPIKNDLFIAPPEE